MSEIARKPRRRNMTITLTEDVARWARIKAAAQRIHQQTIASQAMPIGNLTKMTDEERRLLGAWLAAGAPLK